MYETVRKLLFTLDPERAHGMGAAAARLAQLSGSPGIASTFGYEHPSLEQEAFGLTFPNPVGLAAGFDKNASLVPFWSELGFGFAEVGSVTARPVRRSKRKSFVDRTRATWAYPAG